ncbi:MAG: RepB-like protein, partial [Pediococcus sp.]|nr:RepB-like protein [Pediococcus sp.]
KGFSAVRSVRLILAIYHLQISQMQNLLDQQQRLALQDKKLLEEYKAEIKDLKALAAPTQDSEQAVSPASEPEQATSKSEVKIKHKKWWLFEKSN